MKENTDVLFFHPASLRRSTNLNRRVEFNILLACLRKKRSGMEETMNYSFILSTKVFQEDQCINNHVDTFLSCGKKALVVTGRHSAKACGAYKDVTDTLIAAKISYVVFDEVENNPSIETIERASVFGKKEGIDFVVGIGGGSPLDASKAIAVLVANDFPAIEIFTREYTKVLPIIAIPTTSGTGSEVTPYAVFVRNDLETKMGIGNPQLLPKYALLDPKYTSFMSYDSTISTAVDAFTHNLEGYLANRSQPMSDAFAMKGITLFAECIPALLSDVITSDVREKLMFASMLGGIVITHTGVTLPHGMESIHELGTILQKLIGKAPKLTEDEISLYTGQTILQAKSISNTAQPTQKKDIEDFWRRMSK